jgi:U5 small nuclear ribonucleoprotein component
MMQILGEHESSVKKMLDEFGVYLKPSTFGKDVKPFLKDACSQIFGSATGLVDMMIAHVPSSKAGAANKVGSITGVHDLLLKSARGFTHPHRLTESLWRLRT